MNENKFENEFNDTVGSENAPEANEALDNASVDVALEKNANAPSSDAAPMTIPVLLESVGAKADASDNTEENTLEAETEAISPDEAVEAKAISTDEAAEEASAIDAKVESEEKSVDESVDIEEDKAPIETVITDETVTAEEINDSELIQESFDIPIPKEDANTSVAELENASDDDDDDDDYDNDNDDNDDDNDNNDNVDSDGDDNDNEDITDTDKDSKIGNRLIDSLFDFIELFIFSLAAVFIITTFFFRHSVVDGGSMERTLFDGEHIIISDLFYKPERGDIIVCEDYSTELPIPIVKRVIAIAGDRVEIDSLGNVKVNGELLDESEYVYIDPNFPYICDPLDITVPNGEVFVMGDHRNVSQDSRKIGTIKEDSILGKVLLRFYPFEKFGTVE